MTNNTSPPQLNNQQNAIGDRNIQIIGNQSSVNQTIIHRFFRVNEAQTILHNRRAMLAKVRATWVKGVLEQSLHGIAMIELGLVYKPEAVQYPWEAIVQRPDRLPLPIERGVKIIEVFDQVGGELLILGAPGSGKTTMLLDLTRDLIARAEEDESFSIPVVFNLSAWAEKRPPLANWLVDELWYRYNVPRKISEAWIEQKQLTLLLDGLDEVKTEYRAGCVNSIGDFCQEHGPVCIVVCSRSAEYEALSVQLRLQNAVVLQPLTRDQIDAYLQSGGEQLLAARTLLQRDQVLQDLAESPLILSVMVLAYQGLQVKELGVLDTIEKRRAHLFDKYIQVMFKRRGKNDRYRQDQAIHWLGWLARKMVKHNQTTFYLEGLQPTWLPKYSRLTSGLFFGLSSGVLLGLGVGLFFSLIFGRTFGLLFGISNGLLFGMFFGLFGIFEGMDEIDTIEKVPIKKALTVGLFAGLVVEAYGGLISLLFFNPRVLFYTLLPALFSGLFAGLVTVLTLLDSEIKISETDKIIPNEGIWRSARNAAQMGIFFGLSNGLLFGLFIWAYVDLSSGLGVGLGLGLLIGLGSGLFCGGFACIQHVRLRLTLYRNGSSPLSYVRFLDYCVERILLRKVGGSYIFIHRMFMEHFAKKETEA